MNKHSPAMKEMQWNYDYYFHKAIITKYVHFFMKQKKNIDDKYDNTECVN